MRVCRELFDIVRIDHFATGKKGGGELYRKLKEKGVLVRHFDAPRITDWLRITIGTPEEMQALLAALDEILEA